MTERKGKWKTWSHKEGTKGLDRVRVFERRPGGSISVEWCDSAGDKHSEVLRIGGVAVKDRQTAILIAKRISEELLRKRTGSVLELLGIQKPRKLSELLKALHEDRSPGWKPSYRKSQESKREEWIEWLGPDTVLTIIKADAINRLLNRKQKEHDWAPRTRNGRARYLCDAFLYAQHTLKWITEEHNLSAVKFLKVDGPGDAYEDWELDLLNLVVEEVDLRRAAAFRIARDTGRRIEAILQLTKGDLRIDRVFIEDREMEVELMRIVFGGEHDKASKTGRVYVSPETRETIERLLEAEAVKHSGFLFPNRKRLTIAPVRRESKQIKPIRGEDFLDYLHKAESLTQGRGWMGPDGEDGVQWVKGRGFHGIKRISITIQAAAARTIEVAAKQSGTSVQMLQNVYHQARREDQADLVISLEEKRQKREQRRNGKATGA